MCSIKVINDNFIVFGLIRLDLEPEIYHIGEEISNHYTKALFIPESLQIDQ